VGDGVSARSHVTEKERGTEGDAIAMASPSAVVKQGSSHGSARVRYAGDAVL
jgi:hypothetical protein